MSPERTREQTKSDAERVAHIEWTLEAPATTKVGQWAAKQLAFLLSRLRAAEEDDPKDPKSLAWMTEDRRQWKAIADDRKAQNAKMREATIEDCIAALEQWSKAGLHPALDRALVVRAAVKVLRALLPGKPEGEGENCPACTFGLPTACTCGAKEKNEKLRGLLHSLQRAVNANLDSAQIHFAGLNPLLIEVKAFLAKQPAGEEKWPNVHNLEPSSLCECGEVKDPDNETCSACAKPEGEGA